MLKKRLVTALILMTVMFGTLFYLPSPWVALVLGLFIAAGAYEWAGLIGLPTRATTFFYVSALLVAGAFGIAVVLRTKNPSYFLFFSVLWWLLAWFELARAARTEYTLYDVKTWKLVSGFFLLIPCWVAAVYLHAVDVKSPWLLLYVFLLVWLADTAAYFFGHRFGKHKLAPNVSPGKSVEGMLGAVVACALFAWAVGAWGWRFDNGMLGLWLALSIAATLISVLGDLVESKFKRMAGVKDSGRTLPGHGGVLDRIDSFTAAAPVFAFGWMIFFKSARWPV
jgi:phosphatidate cytidylyltransferase